MAPGKRRPTDDLEGEQRLAKRFDLLNLEHDGKRYYIPTQSSTNSTDPHGSEHSNRNENDYMQLEDSKHKVYIYDLDKELAEVESDEDRPVFIPDIEKHVMKLPKKILLGDDLKAAANKQMILYRLPTSLSVPEDKDSVRKAIIESRRRAQENQHLQIPNIPVAVVLPQQNGNKTISTPYTNGIQTTTVPDNVLEDDPDAMDIG